jgi:hypothetical protein
MAGSVLAQLPGAKLQVPAEVREVPMARKRYLDAAERVIRLLAALAQLAWEIRRLIPDSA